MGNSSLPIIKHFLQIIFFSKVMDYGNLYLNFQETILMWSKQSEERGWYFRNIPYLVETFLAVILEVLGINIHLIFVYSIRTAILCWVINKLFHLHCGFWLSHHIERLDRDKGRCYTIFKNQKIRVCHLIWFFKWITLNIS